MFNLVDFFTSQLYHFLLVLVRVSGIFLFDPFYGSRLINTRTKFVMVVMFSFAVFPMVSGNVRVPVEPVGYAQAVFGELFIGMALGLLVSMVFAGVEFGGQIIGFNMGLAIANVYDPVSGDQVTVISQLNYMLALILFLTVNGHYWIIEALCRSFELTARAPAHMSGQFIEYLMRLSGDMFIIAVKIAAPITVALMLVNTALGILARTMPQMNVFIVGFPLQIGVGFITLSLSLPLFSHVLGKMFAVMHRDMYVILNALTSR